jgi:hypothetical protein
MSPSFFHPEFIQNSSLYVFISAMTDAQDQNPQWIVRLTPRNGVDVESLLQMSLGLDVWERKRDPDMLVVAADEDQISELERRRLATVERISTVGDFVSKFASRSETEAKRRNTKESDQEEA